MVKICAGFCYVADIKKNSKKFNIKNNNEEYIFENQIGIEESQKIEKKELAYITLE